MTRSLTRLALAAALLSSCAPAGSGPGLASGGGPSAEELVRLHERHRVPSIGTRRFTHAELWDALDSTIAGSVAVALEEVGRSAEGRPIRALRYGTGPTKVLLWSQMHGDESTATMALLDLFHFLVSEGESPLARELAERLTIVAVPMLNPDGAERFQRRNAYGVDVNRDARALSTPEARALKGVHARFRPDFGFNLHDQNPRTRVGSSERTAAIALLAPPPGPAGLETASFERAKHLAAAIREAVEPLVAGHVAKYDDSFNPRAFGDLMQSWGTSTVLIESGGWSDDPEKQYLRRVNFVAIVSALESIATTRYARSDPAEYESLPENGPPVTDLLIRGGSVVFGSLAPVRLDVAVNYDEPLPRTGGRVVEVGDLEGLVARDTVDATGLYIHPDPMALGYRTPSPSLGPGASASFVFRRGPTAASEAVHVMHDGRMVR